MSVHRFVLDVQCPDDHLQLKPAPATWTAVDLYMAMDRAVVDPGKCVITYKGRVSEEGHEPPDGDDIALRHDGIRR